MRSNKIYFIQCHHFVDQFALASSLREWMIIIEKIEVEYGHFSGQTWYKCECSIQVFFMYIIFICRIIANVLYYFEQCGKWILQTKTGCLCICGKERQLPLQNELRKFVEVGYRNSSPQSSTTPSNCVKQYYASSWGVGDVVVVWNLLRFKQL